MGLGEYMLYGRKFGIGMNIFQFLLFIPGLLIKTLQKKMTLLLVKIEELARNMATITKAFLYLRISIEVLNYLLILIQFAFFPHFFFFTYIEIFSTEVSAPASILSIHQKQN